MNYKKNTFLESLPSPKILYKSASKASPEVFQTAIQSKKICRNGHSTCVVPACTLIVVHVRHRASARLACLGLLLIA